jgi:hypothetical protein
MMTTHSNLNNSTQSIASKIVGHVRRHEGGFDVNYPYLDSKGLMTVGPGFLVDDVDQFAALPLEFETTPGQPARPATEAEKRQAYSDVKNARSSLGANAPAQQYQGIAKMVLPEAEIEARLSQEVATRIGDIQKDIGVQAWNGLTEGQKTVMVDVHYANGSLDKYPSLKKAAQAGDGDAMARESIFHSGVNAATGQKTRNWDRVFENYQMASGKPDSVTAYDLSRIFKARGETVPSKTRISRNNFVAPNAKPTEPPRPITPGTGQTGAGTPGLGAPGVGAPAAPPPTRNPHTAQAPESQMDTSNSSATDATPTTSALSAQPTGSFAAITRIDDPVQEILLKQTEQWTDSEMRKIMASDGYWKSNHPDWSWIQDRIKAWHDRTYGTAPMPYDAAGRMMQTPPVVNPNEEPVMAKDKFGMPLKESLHHIASQLAQAAVGDGEIETITALQEGLNQSLFHDNKKNIKRSIGAPLKVDGVLGPKTVQAIHRVTSGVGRSKVEEAFGLGRFAQKIKNPSIRQNPKELKRSLDQSIGALFSPVSKPSDTKATPEQERQIEAGTSWGRALQATLNDHPAQELKVGPKLREDGVIGPKTPMALNQTLNGTGVPDFMQRFRQNLGFS